MALPTQRQTPRSLTPSCRSASELRRARRRACEGSRPRLRGSARRPLSFGSTPRSQASGCRCAPSVRRPPRRASARPRDASIEAVDVLCPLFELRGARAQDAGLLWRSEELQVRADTRPRYASVRDRQRSVDPAPRPEGHDTGAGEPRRTLVGLVCALGDCLVGPKTASALRELASKPRDPSAHAVSTSTPRGVRQRRRRVLRGPADLFADIETTFRPRRDVGQALSPRRGPGASSC